jgi:hypothetical protein
LLTLWCDSPYPADPSYFLDVLRTVDIGRIDPQHTPWRLQNKRLSGEPN